MIYTFKKKRDWYFIEVDDVPFQILERFTYFGWTPEKIQSIIDGVETSKTKERGEEYFWGNEDVRLYANKNGVFLIDDLGARAGETDPDKLYLILSHDEMLQFLKDFKKFVEENS